MVGKGYRFIGPVRVIDARFSQSHHERNASDEPDRERVNMRTERPSLAVRPLFLLGKIHDDQGVCLGFADALVSRLGNLQGVDVLPTSAMLNVPAQMTSSDVGSRLGVRFVIHGAIQESKGQWLLSLEMFDTHLADLGSPAEVRSRRLSSVRSRRRDCQTNRQRPKQTTAPDWTPTGALDIARIPMAYAEFVHGYRLSSSSDPALLEEAAQHLSTAVTRDPGFSLAHATLSLVCASRHFEVDPASIWLEKAEFHCRRALEVDPDLPEGHVANAFLLWGPSKNFQHLEAIAELRRALALQKNLPHAYNRLGTILAHIGLLDHAREMYERGRPFQPGKAVSHSIVQVYVWNREYDLAREEIRAWRTESPANKYPVYFAPQLAMMTEDWNEAKALLDEAIELLPEEPLTISLLGVYYALRGKAALALACLTRACSSAKSFGHAHHTYYQVACILSLLERPNEAFGWLERSVSTGFACWPFFLKDPCLQNLRPLPEFDVLISALQAKYPDHLGLL